MKTLEFPYGSSTEIPVPDRSKADRTGPDPPLNQPSSDRTGRVRKPAVSGQFRVDETCHRKGSSHSGFLMIFFTLFRNQLFLKKCPDPVTKGSGSGHPRVPDPVKRDQMLSISGSEDPWTLGPGVPGSIQHLPRITLGGLWLPGENCRRYGNRRRTSVLLLRWPGRNQGH